ncbi:MAG: ABC transporter ATP-binding protein [Pseudomonadota bacterium]|nr:ABC transporter ATP-binding protein [Pseudomonadota bacterium]
MKVIFDKIDKHYGEVKAVDRMALEIADGELHFLLGSSGCGKTTALRILAGLETPTGGKIFFNSTDVTNYRAVDRRVGMVFQNYALWPHMTVYKNIEYGLKVRKENKHNIEAKIKEVLELTRLEAFVDRLPGQLSGGQQQRVALARAFALTPSVLLLDEPLSNLDAKLRREMRDNLLDIHQRTNITTLYVTHDQEEALTMGKKITVMQAGRVLQTATPRELYNRPASPYLANFIGETNLITGQVLEQQATDNYLVATPIGKLRCRSADSFAVNEQVSLSIRPENFKLVDGNHPQTQQDMVVSMELKQLNYLGASEQLLLVSASAPEIVIKANLNDQHEFSVGEQLEFAITPASVQMFRVDP